MTRKKAGNPWTAACGCSAPRGPVRFCPVHAAAFAMADVLRAVRGHYLARPTADGKPWPFVEAIDAVLPRDAPGPAAAPGPPRDPDDPLVRKVRGLFEARGPRDDDDRETIEPGDSYLYRTPGQGGPG